jgi:hypothetical protein
MFFSSLIMFGLGSSMKVFLSSTVILGPPYSEDNEALSLRFITEAYLYAYPGKTPTQNNIQILDKNIKRF